jgi:hypothetical protein
VFTHSGTITDGREMSAAHNDRFTLLLHVDIERAVELGILLRNLEVVVSILGPEASYSDTFTWVTLAPPDILE